MIYIIVSGFGYINVRKRFGSSWRNIVSQTTLTSRPV